MRNLGYIIPVLCALTLGLSGCGDSNESTSSASGGGSQDAVSNSEGDASDTLEDDAAGGDTLLGEEDAGDGIAVPEDGADSEGPEDGSENEDVTQPLATDLERIPLGARGAINGLFAVNKDRVYAVGNKGTMLWWNGVGWIPMDIGTTVAIHGIWGLGENLAYAVGDNGTVAQFDGANWSPVVLDTAVDLYGVYGFSADDVYVVGQNGYIGHWDGEIWTSQVSNVQSDLNTVWGPSSDSVFVGGDQAKVLRRTGGVWVSSVVAASSVTVNDLWGTSSSNVYAVGTKGSISRWNGSGWNTMVSNDFDLHDLQAIWGSSEENIFVVGDAGVILQYEEDSDDWSLDIVGGPFNKSENLRALAGYLDLEAGLTDSKKTKAFTAGEDALFMRLDNGNWSDTESGLALDLHDLWVTDSVAVAVGDGGTIVRRKTAGWAGEKSSTTKNLYSVTGFASSLVAVGEDGVVLERSNGLWNGLLSPVDDDLFGVVETNDGFLAVGEKGTIIRYSQGEWAVEESGVLASLTDIWTNSSGAFYVVGETGTILYSNTPGEWSSVVSGTSSNLEAVYGRDDLVWAVGNWTVISGNASGFSVAETFSSDYLYGIWVSPDDTVVTVGWAGLLMVLESGDFLEVPTGSSEVLESVMGVSSSDFFAVGRDGVLLRYREMTEQN